MFARDLAWSRYFRILPGLHARIQSFKLFCWREEKKQVRLYIIHRRVHIIYIRQFKVLISIFFHENDLIASYSWKIFCAYCVYAILNHFKVSVATRPSKRFISFSKNFTNTSNKQTSIYTHTNNAWKRWKKRWNQIDMTKIR